MKPSRTLVLQALVLGTLLSGCATSFFHPSTPQAQTAPPQKESIETLAILGSNDIHGNLAPISMKADSPAGPIHFESGGAANLSAYIDILRSEFGDHLLWLDAGDQFQGTLESNRTGGAPMVQFFNFKNLTSAAIGNHEFDFGLPTLKARMTEAHYPYLAGNITDLNTGKPAEFPHTQAHMIVPVGTLKVGIFGLSTLDTPMTTRAQHVKTLRFENLKEVTLREVASLRKEGADIVVMTAHVGLFCPAASRGASAYQMRKPSDPQEQCRSGDEMVQLLESLPSGTVDAVISGHSHTIVHHWIGGTPVIQAGSYGRYLNVIYLNYDRATHQVLPDQTRIEGPIPVCSQVFQNQNDCNGDRPAPKNGRGPLVTARFHGKPIYASAATQALIAPSLKEAEQERTQKLGFAAKKMEHLHGQESPLGNLIADAIRAHAQSDFAIMNSGGIRAPIEAGPITYGAVFRTIPFDNAISVIKVSGEELLTILRVAESGSRNLASVSGLKIKMIRLSAKAPIDDLTGQGRFEPWETNRLLEVKKSDGTPIDPHQWYTLAALDFLVTGGDDLRWPMSRIPEDRIQLDKGILVRDALVAMIQHSGPLNSENHPLVDPQNPRITLVNAPHHFKRHSSTKGAKKTPRRT
jgi:5'-nucleotidase